MHQLSDVAGIYDFKTPFPLLDHCDASIQLGEYVKALFFQGQHHVYHNFWFHLGWIKNYQSITPFILVTDYELSLASSISLENRLFKGKCKSFSKLGLKEYC